MRGPTLPYAKVATDEHGTFPHPDSFRKKYSKQTVVGLVTLLVIAYVAVSLWGGSSGDDAAVDAVPGLIPIEGNNGGGFDNGFVMHEEQWGINQVRFPHVMSLTSDVNVPPADAIAGNKKLFSKELENGRYQSYLFLDKPVYLPGEILHVGFFVLDGIYNKPIDHSQVGGSVTIKDAKDIIVHTTSIAGAFSDASGSFHWQIPSNAGGGEYKVFLNVYPYNQEKTTITNAMMTFEVRAISKSAPKIKKKIEFEQHGYRMGGRVQARLIFEDLASEAVVETSVDGVARVDDVDVFTKQFTYAGSSLLFEFTLPESIKNPTGCVVTFRVTRGGVFETISKTIPVVTDELDIGVFPESGVVVCDRPGRIYIECLNRITKDPVDCSGEILLGDKSLAPIRTAHEGRGVTTDRIVFRCADVKQSSNTPVLRVGAQTVKIPFRVTPSATLAGVKHAFAPDEGIVVDVFGAGEGYSVGLYKKHKLVDSRALDGSASSVSFVVKEKIYGVFRVTLVNAEQVPVAERLVYRHPYFVLEFDVRNEVVDNIDQQEEDAAIRAHYEKKHVEKIFPAEPGDGIKTTVYSYRTKFQSRTIEDREPISCIVSVGVTDASLSSTVDERLLPPRLAAQVYLEQEVDRLHRSAHFSHAGYQWLQSGEVPSFAEAERNIDLLLGVQGWRRFAYYDARGFLQTETVEYVPARGFLPAGSKRNKQGDVVNEGTHLKASRMFAVIPPPKLMRMQVKRANMFMANHAMEDRAEVMPMMAGAAVPEMAVMAQDQAMGNENNEENKQFDDAEDEAPPPPANGIMAAKRAFIAPGHGTGWFKRVYYRPQRKFSKKELEQGNPARSDFRETVYFNPGVKTKCVRGGVCAAVFYYSLSEASSTSFVLHLDGVGELGELGGGHSTIKTSLPLELDFALPDSLIVGDRVSVGVRLISPNKETKAKVEVSEKLLSLMDAESSFEKERIFKNGVPHDRMYVNLAVTKHGVGSVKFSARNGVHKDAMEKTVPILQKGFPSSANFGGVITAKTHAEFAFSFPPALVKSTVQKPRIHVYTSPIGRLTKAIESLVREPCGCFEQTSSTTFPLIFVIKYLQTHAGASPTLLERAKAMLRKGYDKLVSYETKTGGFEWFGASPGHEALTAYGLFQFTMISQLGGEFSTLVDGKMMARTKDWLESRRDKQQGGYLRDSKALDSFGAAPAHTTNAYIVYSLAKSNMDVAELENLLTLSSSPTAPHGKDPYVMALIALSLFERNQRLDEAKALAKKLVRFQDEQSGGVFKEAKDTITRSMGEALQLETTALVALVWMKQKDEFAGNVRRAIDFINEKCKDGRFASTQATALSLMAIVEYDALYSRDPPKTGALHLFVNDELVDVHAFKQDGDGDDGKKKKCKGDLVFNECASACEPTCENQDPGPCTAECVAKCACPKEKPYYAGRNQCLTLDECEGDREGKQQQREGGGEDGVISFDGDKVFKAMMSGNGKGKMAFRIKYKKQSTRRLADEEDGENASGDEVYLPFSASFEFNVNKKQNSEEEFALFSTAITKSEMKEGEVGSIKVTLKNLKKNEKGESDTLPMVVAIVGIPGGVEVRTDQLRELKENKKVDFYETKPGQVIFYWRALSADFESENLEISFVTKFAGEYTGQASRVYLFYNDEEKIWADGLSLTVKKTESVKDF